MCIYRMVDEGFHLDGGGAHELAEACAGVAQQGVARGGEALATHVKDDAPGHKVTEPPPPARLLLHLRGRALDILTKEKLAGNCSGRLVCGLKIALIWMMWANIMQGLCKIPIFPASQAHLLYWQPSWEACTPCPL